MQLSLIDSIVFGIIFGFFFAFMNNITRSLISYLKKMELRK